MVILINKLIKTVVLDCFIAYLLSDWGYVQHYVLVDLKECYFPY